MGTVRNEQYELPDVGEDYTEQDPAEGGFVGHIPGDDDNEKYTVKGVLAQAEEDAKARDKEAKAAEKEAAKHEKENAPKES